MQTYEKLDKGLQGELKFFHLLKRGFSGNHYIVLYDLLLEVNQSLFQIDCLLIFKQQIYLLEIKNYEGEFVLKDGEWFKVSGNRQIRSPIQQLDRSKILLEQFLRKNGFSFTVLPYVVFVNDTFMLYEAPVNLPVVFPAQQLKFIHKLNNITSSLVQKHQQLATILVDNHLNQSPYERVPEFKIEELKKGIVCNSCQNLLIRKNNYKLLCSHCGDLESISSGVMRSVVEFNILFPNMLITAISIYEWCGRIISKRGIRNILLKHMEPKGIKNHRFYLFR